MDRNCNNEYRFNSSHIMSLCKNAALVAASPSPSPSPSPSSLSPQSSSGYTPPPPRYYSPSWKLLSQGAEARIWYVPSYGSASLSSPSCDTTSNDSITSVGGQTNSEDCSNNNNSTANMLVLLPAICKERFPKSYRHAALDRSLTKSRIKSEVKSIVKCRKYGIPCPTVLGVDMKTGCLFLEVIPGRTVREFFEKKMQFITDIGKAATLHPQVKQSSNRIDNAVVQRKGNTKNDDEAETHCETTFSLRFDQYAMRIAEAIGVLIAKMHNANVIHGDLTTSNIMLSNFPQSLTHSLEQQSSQVPTKDSDKDDEIVENMENNDVGETMWVPKLTVIDFGLAGTAGSRGVNSEEMAVDLYVLERAFLSTHPGTESTVAEIMRSYKKNCTASDAVLARLFSVRQRGRKRECFG